MNPSTPSEPVSGLIAGLVESLTQLFGPAPRRQFAEQDLRRLDCNEPFNRLKIVVAASNGASYFKKADLERVRRLIAENVEANVELETACDPTIRARYKADPGGLDDQALQARLDQAQQVRRRIKAAMRARRKEISDILRPGLQAAAADVDRSALCLLEAEAAAASHFGLGFSPSSLVRAMATAARLTRQQAEFEATANDIEGMTCGLISK